MTFKNLFKTHLEWSLQPKGGETGPFSYSRNHTLEVEGKPILNISAAKTYKGDPDLYNPEDLLLNSLTSCHMMSYLYVCAKNGIEVLSYSDHAEATLEVLPDGSGHFSEVRLNPNVIIKNSTMISLALELHKKANELCFIANSCNFPVLHHPTCEASLL